MKLIASLLLLSALPLAAIPNSVTGGVNQAASPLNGKELTDDLLSTNLWDGKSKLPGRWKKETTVADAEISHLLARPKVFGLDTVLVRATHRDGAMETLSVTFVDAGSYFPYLQRRPDVPIETQRQQLLEKQKEFQKLYSESQTRLAKELQLRSGRRKPKDSRYGSSRILRAEVSVYRIGDLYASLFSNNGRLLRVMLSKNSSLFRKTWLDSSRSNMSAREQSAFYQKQVQTSKNGDHLITNLRPVPQGYRPYCGLNSLSMTAQYFGLHIDEDWMAVAGKFQNTGSAAGSNMLSLYNATASEARLAVSRETKFNYATARSLLRNGMPVIVWRRFDSGRNRLHSRFAKQFAKDNSVELPLADQSDRATWPGDKHPVHASVIVGFNDKRKEILFLESWIGQSTPRRMRYEELEATATMAFYFKTK